ncbi:MAG: 30S ribosomal protein S16 [Candidatus Phytoplasma australasiaticum]|nr:30S ribosomal protein S16 [Candidatus Phytoplasma australasiaticum]
MSVKIRLQLFGSRHKPFYRVVAIDASKVQSVHFHPKLTSSNFKLIPKHQVQTS